MNYLKRFQYVTTVAQCGSFSRAADKLSISQPTLSKYISKLEGELELSLFDRNSSPLKLTKAGEHFVNAGVKMLSVDSQLNRRLDSIRQNSSMEIKLGISMLRSKYLLPQIFASYSHNNDTKIYIDECNTQEITDKLSGGKIDLAISLLDDKTSNFEREELFEETVLLAAPKSFRDSIKKALDGDSYVHLSRLCDLPFVSVTQSQYLRKALDLLCEDKVTPVYECQFVESALSLVRSGVGMTLVPSYVKEYGAQDDDGLDFYSLYSGENKHIKKTLERTVCVFYRKDQFLSQPEKDLISCCVNICKNR